MKGAAKKPYKCFDMILTDKMMSRKFYAETAAKCMMLLSHIC